jgi:hypothetical protein
MLVATYIGHEQNDHLYECVHDLGPVTCSESGTV